MSEYTKYSTSVYAQYSETVYLKDGKEIARERNFDDECYDYSAEEPMTKEEIQDYGDEED